MIWKFSSPTFEYEKSYADLGGPWAGHKYFAYDLIMNLKPKHVVELGTHLGCSLFSFVQAVKDGKLKTRLDAVDTWKGDEHAGFYPEQVFVTLNEIKQSYYSDVDIHLIRTTFDKAAKKYSKGSIDILHIDGRHTYEDVKHDFETWVDKVKDDGIILFHDSAVKKWGFGIYKLMKELRKQYKIVEFEHSFGLGVLFKDPKTYEELAGRGFEMHYEKVAKRKQMVWDLKQKWKSWSLRIENSLALRGIRKVRKAVTRRLKTILVSMRLG
jgi:hypothetical protein